MQHIHGLHCLPAATLCLGSASALGAAVPVRTFTPFKHTVRAVSECLNNVSLLMDATCECRHIACFHHCICIPLSYDLSSMSTFSKMQAIVCVSRFHSTKMSQAIALSQLRNNTLCAVVGPHHTNTAVKGETAYLRNCAKFDESEFGTRAAVEQESLTCTRRRSSLMLVWTR